MGNTQSYTRTTLPASPAHTTEPVSEITELEKETVKVSEEQSVDESQTDVGTVKLPSCVPADEIKKVKRIGGIRFNMEKRIREVMVQFEGEKLYFWIPEEDFYDKDYLNRYLLYLGRKDPRRKKQSAKRKIRKTSKYTTRSSARNFRRSLVF